MRGPFVASIKGVDGDENDRMTSAIFDELLVLVGPHIVKQTITFRNPVGVPKRIGITLKYVDFNSYIFFVYKCGFVHLSI